MTMENCDPRDQLSPEPSAEMADEVLDAILKHAYWPEVTAESVGRLERVVDSALRTRILATPASVRASMDRGWTRPVPLCVISSVLLLIAFLGGHWAGIRSERGRQAGLSEFRLPNEGLPVADEFNSADDANNTVHKDSSLASRTSAAPDTAAPDTATEPEDESMETPLVADQPPEIPAGSETNLEALPGPLTPLADEIFHGRPIPRREQYRKQLNAVLSCLAEQKVADQGCVLPLMAKRAEFEYLLWEVIRNSTGQQRLTALTAVGLIGSERSVPLLLNSSTDRDLRTVSLSALKRCAGEKTLAAFVLQQQDTALAYEFAVELAHRPTAMALQTWIHLVQNRDSRGVCLQASNELRKDLVEMLFSTLDAPLVADRVAAAISLGARTDVATRERLTGLVNNYPLRWEPVAALMWNASPEAMQTLSQLQNHPQRMAVLQTAGIQLSAYTGPDR